MTTHTIFIDGEAGTTGLEIRERLEARGDLDLMLLGDRRRDVDARRQALNAADAVILCLPDDASREAVAMIENPSVKVIDASTAYRAYGLTLKHKHVPEMTKHSGLSRPVLFAPAVGNYRQGMLVEVPLHLSALPETPSVERLHGALVEAYEGQRVVEVADLEETEALTGIEPEALNGTNRLRLHVFGDRGGEQARLVALLDNLGKGASGAAVQNLNIMLGLDEATGLN